MNICILKENNPNEFRTPLTPIDIKRLKKRHPRYNFYIEPSKNRIFSDSLFYKSGCKKYTSQNIDLFLETLRNLALSSRCQKQNTNQVKHHHNQLLFFSFNNNLLISCHVPKSM